jgi:hypothetical protein
MRTLVKITLPDEIMERMPQDKEGIITFLSRYFEDEVNDYSSELQRQAPSPFNQPLNRYERSLVKDYLMRKTLGALLQQGEATPMSDAPLAAVK